MIWKALKYMDSECTHRLAGMRTRVDVVSGLIAPVAHVCPWRWSNGMSRFHITVRTSDAPITHNGQRTNSISINHINCLLHLWLRNLPAGRGNWEPPVFCSGTSTDSLRSAVLENGNQRWPRKTSVCRCYRREHELHRSRGFNGVNRKRLWCLLASAANMLRVHHKL